MAARARLETPLSSDDPVLLHGDPDLRPGLLDGLIVNGLDPLAERRRQMREAHDGRPDPATAPLRVRSSTTAVPPAPLHAGVLGEVQIITETDFATLANRRGITGRIVATALAALARGECIFVPIAADRVRGTCNTLRKTAKRHGMKLEIRGGPDFVAARAIKEQTR